MRIFIVTAFPSLFEGVFGDSILKRAQKKGLAKIHLCDLREFTTDKHRQIDDYPYGGGPGMILKPEPFFRAYEMLHQKHDLHDPRVILTTPQGRKYDQAMAEELSQERDVVLLCGHYKGIDERVREHLSTDEVSIGDYILTGGVLAGMVMVDSIVRLLPGVLSDPDSAKTDSFAIDMLDCPYYTRPEDLNGMKVPEVLLSGNHAEIARWRREKALQRTRERRSDLLPESST